MSSSTQSYPSLVLTQQILTLYVYPCIVFFGTLGNLLNIIFFLRKTLRTTSCNNYFLASAFSSLAALYIGIIPTLYTYDRSWAITIAYCKIRSYMFNAFQQMSRYFIVSACLDRFALCSRNANLRKFCRVQVARRYVIPSVIITWLLVPIHMPIFYTASNNSCILPGALALYNGIYGISLVGFLPPMLMRIFSLLTFRNLKLRQRQQVRPLATVNTHLSTNQSQNQQKKDQQAFGMLMIQVLVYASTTTVSSSYSVYSVVTTYIGITKSNEQRSIESFISFITGMLNYTCPCLSFYLFLLVSNLYRKEVKAVIRQVCNRCCLP